MLQIMSPIAAEVNKQAFGNIRKKHSPQKNDVFDEHVVLCLCFSYHKINVEYFFFLHKQLFVNHLIQHMIELLFFKLLLL